MLKNTLLSLAVLTLIVFHAGCKGIAGANGFSDRVEINLPLNSTAVYASGFYLESDSSLDPQFLEIFSVKFTGSTLEGDTLFYEGEISRFSEFVGWPVQDQVENGIIRVSIDEDWVLYQYSDLHDAYRIFFKSSRFDSTAPPTDLLAQFPVFPRTMTSNAVYRIHRPGAGDSWIAIEREFSCLNFMTWDDAYASDRGLYIRLLHRLELFTDPIEYYLLADERGLVVSQLSDIVISREGDSVEGYTHRVTRRIVDFTEPGTIRPLQYYNDLVITNGLDLLKQAPYH